MEKDKRNKNFKVELFYTIMTSDDYGQVAYNFKDKEKMEEFKKTLEKHNLIEKK